MSEERRADRVPDDGLLRAFVGRTTDQDGFDDAIGRDVGGGFDSDADGRPDTLVTDDGVDLVLLTDLDADGLADRALRIGPAGVTRDGPPPAPAGTNVLDGLLGGAQAGWDH